MTDIYTNRLSEYLDDELAPVERADVARHLESCAECRAVLDDLRRVVTRAGQLEDSLPDTDLWAGVRSAMDARQVTDIRTRRVARRISFSVPQLVAAAAALVLVSGGSAWMFSRGPAVEEPALVVVEKPVPVRPVTFDRRARADSAIAELERALAEGQSRLDTSTVRILTNSLAVIDRAITQARTALANDPANPYLNEHLARTMRKKIEVLRRAADLAAAS